MSLSTHTGQMGWREFRTWLRTMGEQLRGPEPRPDRWDEAGRQNFDELAARRERIRGR